MSPSRSKLDRLEKNVVISPRIQGPGVRSVAGISVELGCRDMRAGEGWFPATSQNRGLTCVTTNNRAHFPPFQTLALP